MAEANNYFIAKPSQPYHLSVGVVLVNGKHEVACHYFDELEFSPGKVVKDFYILMRETVHQNESLEQAAARGLMEEFGAKGQILSFLGSIQATKIPAVGHLMHKTTLYFLVRLGSIDTSLRDPEDPEYSSRIEWRTVDYLIDKMQSQFERLQREDTNEAEVLERAKAFIKTTIK